MIFICFTTFLVLYYILGFFDTNEVLDDFYNCVRYQKYTDSALDRYVPNDLDEVSAGANIDITRRFVFHNFFKGFMLVNYSYNLYDSKHEESKGAHDVNSLWFIEKKGKNGELSKFAKSHKDYLNF